MFLGLCRENQAGVVRLLPDCITQAIGAQIVQYLLQVIRVKRHLLVFMTANHQLKRLAFLHGHKLFTKVLEPGL